MSGRGGRPSLDVTDKEAVERAVRAYVGELDESPDEVLSEHLGNEVTRFDDRWFKLAREVVQRVEGANRRRDPSLHESPDREAGRRFEDRWHRTLDNTDADPEAA